MKYSTLVDFDLQSDFAHILPDEEQNHHNPHDSHSSSNTSSHPSGMHQFTAKEIDRMNRGLPPWESMSFACGGWLQFYMFGVAKGLQACKMDKGVRYYGCSAGALTAAGLVLDGEFDEAIQFCKDYCLPKAYSDIRGLFNLADYVQKCLDLTLLAKFHQGVEPNTLFVAATKLPLGQAERFTVFRTHEDLSTALLCSSAAFPFAPLVKHKGSWYIDGGLSDFQPVEDDNTITVSPFYFSECDIKPSRYIPLWWTFLPPKNTDTVEWLYKLGFEDCINYMKQRGIPIQFHKHGEYYESIIDHPYNDQGQVSIHRFLGYDLKNFTHEYVSFIMDFFLLILLIFVWKPLALCLIYVELFCKIMVLMSLSILHTLMEFYPPFLIKRLLVNPYFKIMSYFVGISFLQKEASLSKADPREAAIRDLWECILCVGSLSLLMRFISGPPSTVELNKHKKLAKLSVIYRVFRHMI